MKRLSFIFSALWLIASAHAGGIVVGPIGGVPSGVTNGTGVDSGPIGPSSPAGIPTIGGIPASPYANFASSLYYYNGVTYGSFTSWLTAIGGTFARADGVSGAATNLLPTSVSGFSYSTFASNVARITSGSGLLSEGSRTNLFLNSAVPATQTITLSNTTYILWVNGTGSITVSAGTATGCGSGVATNGTPVTITITGGGTCIFTLAGSLNFAQVEAGPSGSGSSGIVTTAASVARGADNLLVGPNSGTPFSGFSTTAGTVLLVEDINYSTATPGLFPTGVAFNDNTANNDIDTSAITSSLHIASEVIIGGVTQQNTGTSLPTFTGGVFFKQAKAWQANDFSDVVNGGTPVTDNSGTIPTVDRLGIGNFPSLATGALFGYVKQFAYWSFRASNADLQGLTQ